MVWFQLPTEIQQIFRFIYSELTIVGNIILCSALFEVDRKADAVKYLRMAAAYDPGYNDLLERCEKDEENLVGDLVHSRRRDY